MSQITITPVGKEFAVSFPYDRARLDDFKRQFPSAKWDGSNKRWIVGPRTGPKAQDWATSHNAAATKAAADRAWNAAETATKAKAAADEAAKAITSQYVTRTADGGFRVRTPYDPKIVAEIKALPGARFDGATKTWTLPASSGPQLVGAASRIDAMAAPLVAAERKAAEEARKAAAVAAKEAKRQVRIDALAAKQDAAKERAATRARSVPRPAPMHEIRSTVRGGGQVGLGAYVARVEGTHSRYHLMRAFVGSDKHLSRSHRSGTLDFAIHRPGLYETQRIGTHAQSIATQARTGGGSERAYLRVTNTGKVRDVSAERAKALAVRAERLAPRMRGVATAMLPAVERPPTLPARSYSRADNLAVRRQAYQITGQQFRTSTAAREVLSAHYATVASRRSIDSLASSAMGGAPGSYSRPPTDRVVERAASSVEGLKMQAKALGIPQNHTKRWLTEKVTQAIVAKPNALASWRAGGRLAPMVAIAAGGAAFLSDAARSRAEASPRTPPATPARRTGDAGRSDGPIAVTYTTGIKAGTTEYRRRANV
jgi:hypothetical protein